MEDQFEQPAEITGQRMAKANQAARPTKCRTCGGDRFVVVTTRPVAQTAWMKRRGITPPVGAAYDEYAPCPDCNTHTDTSFYCANGSEFRSPDPAQVREYLRR